MNGTISRYYPPGPEGGVGRFAHLHDNRETLLEPVDVEGGGQIDFHCPDCPDRASVVFGIETKAQRAEHAQRMADESRRWGRDREAAYWERAKDAEPRP